MCTMKNVILSLRLFMPGAFMEGREVVCNRGISKNGVMMFYLTLSFYANGLIRSYMLNYYVCW
jgi:hypothetical protein